MTISRLLWLVLGLLLLISPALVLAQTGPADSWECTSCGKDWPIRAGETPTKCPHCNAAFTHTVGLDGGKAGTGAAEVEDNPNKKYFLAAGAAILLIAFGMVVVKLVTGAAKSKQPKSKRMRDE